MWFTDKSKNHRHRRQTLLDVKLRSDQVRAGRLRVVWVLLAIVGGGALAFLLLWRGGQLALDRLIYQNPSFAVQTIEVQTDGVIALEQLRKWSGVKPGDNLFALDLLRVKRDLEMIPVIKSAAVQRVLPNALRLTVVEREPIAQVVTLRPRAGNGFDRVVYHLDETGMVMQPMDRRLTTDPEGQANDWLPLLTGVNGAELMSGRMMETPQVLAALRLIASFDHSPMTGLADLQRVDVSAPEILQAFTGQGTEVVFAVADLERQLRRWRLVHDLGLRNGRTLSAIDLSISNNLPARWAAARALPPASIKPKTSRYKKKNV
jgi:cell division septal protein FtsQ